jgi:hypothetical protein
MKRIFLLLVAALSAAPVHAAQRPRYGGTLRIEMRGNLTSFDAKPAATADDELLRDIVLNSVCNRLLTLDADGDPRASLATAWRSERDGRSWYFSLRDGVTLHNGSALTQQTVITALAAANPTWRVRAEERDVLIQTDTPAPDILFQLAEPRNSVCLAGDNGEWIGSGPFQIASFQSGQMELRSFENAWEGQPFLERIHIEMNKSLADQLADQQLGRADVIEADSQFNANGNLEKTEPIELIALIFSSNHPATSDQRLRQALALAIDRNSIFSVLLRHQGEPSASLLPQWISGYAHVFSTAQDVVAAKSFVGRVMNLVPLSLASDANDPLLKLIAERVAVNAREAAIGVQPVAKTSTSNPDINIVRLRIASPNAATDLSDLGTVLRIPSLEKAQAATSADVLFTRESDVLEDHSVIPIAQIPEAFAVSPAVHDWKMTRWGNVDWGDLWLEVSK